MTIKLYILKIAIAVILSTTILKECWGMLIVLGMWWVEELGAELIKRGKRGME